MDIKALAAWLARRSLRVLWFIVRNPFLILRKAFCWGLVALFWLFLLGWGISAFAAEWTPAQLKPYYSDFSKTGVSSCRVTSDYNVTHSYAGASGSISSCQADIHKGTLSTYLGGVKSVSGCVKTSSTTLKCSLQFVVGNWTSLIVGTDAPIPPDVYACPPDGKSDFTVGPKTLNGQQVCEKKPVSCKVGEQLFMDSTTGAETCKPNCGKVAGQTLENVAYNQAFLPSATVSCFGLCSVTSSGVTVGDPKTFEQFGNIQFTGSDCPVKFPNEGTGQVIGNNPPVSSADTAAAQSQLQNAASAASGSPVSGVTGTATLNDVVNKVAEASNKQVKAMSDQNAAMGKLMEGVGKDIQGAIKDSAQVGGAGASAGQLQTANAIKEGNKKLQEISDKLDKKDDGKDPVSPGTALDADPTKMHDSNDWKSRNFGTVMKDNANRFKALPIFSAPTSFFKADFGGSSCPSYAGQFSLFGTSTNVQLDAFCSPTVLNVMPYIRAVVIMFFGWLAWRIAVGNWG